MAEGLQKSMQDILKKLEKLDAIEKAVNNLGKSLGKLEGRLHALEDSYASTKSDVNESLNANKADKKTTANSLAALQKENDELHANFKLIKDKNLHLEAYSRRENIKFENIPEEDTENGIEFWRHCQC